LTTAAQRLRELLPADVQQKWLQDEAKERELTEMLRTNCIDALELIASALRYPRISLHHLEAAVAMLTVARDCAKVLDQ
jgi:hypothetical protein